MIELSQILGYKHHAITPYVARANGAAEIFMSKLKKGLKLRLQDLNTDWVNEIPT